MSAVSPVSAEIRIPVPWGHIAGKAWGSPLSVNPVLALHGSMDNAATFDRLIPLLPQQCYYVSIDLPGHGRSSHLAPGMPYHFTDNIIFVRRVIDFFGWTQVTILGHSFGGFVGAFAAAMYPDIVTKLVMLDIIGPRSTAPEWTIGVMRFVDNKIIESEKFDKSSVPEYSYDTILQRLKQGRATTITDAAAKALLSRCIVKKGDNFSFSIDQRLKSAVHPPLDKSQISVIYSKIKCPVLVVFAEDSKPNLTRDFVIDFIQVLKTNCKSFQLVFVQGNHDVHLNNAEIVAPHVSRFVFPKTKCWGRPDGLPMLGVHGLQDNAATFDRLAPMLPATFYFVSIDLPGHGTSSHLPEGQLYHFTDMVTVVNRVVDHFRWQRFYYLGHSLGGQIGSYFAAFYPEKIIKLIMLDVVRPRPLEAKNYIPAFKHASKKLLEIEKKISKNSMPCYTFEEAKRRMFESRWSELTQESADILLKRSLCPYNGGYVFGQDQRLKFFVFPPHTHEQQLALLSNVRCSLLIIKARDSLQIFNFKGVKATTELYSKNCLHYEELTVEGNHDVHINHPERVATLISNFLLHHKSQL